MKNVMFREAPIPKPSSGAFDLSHEKKLSMQIGHLVPFMWYDVVPGDKFRIKSEILVKFSPLLAPLLHRVDVYTHYFFVPYRIIMPRNTDGGNSYGGWQDFITDDPEDQFNYQSLPYVTIDNTTKSYFVKGSLADYLGLPVIDTGTTVSQDVDILALPFLAYHQIYDDYYRDESLTNRILREDPGAGQIMTRGGDLNTYITNLCRTVPYTRALEKDYFRGALDTAYTGSDSDVELDIDIFGANRSIGIQMEIVSSGAFPTAGDPTFSGADKYLRDSANNTIAFREGVDTSLSAPLEIMELRRAEALTRFLEAERRGGYRYQEMLLGIYGVISDNAELQVPQYIGGGKQAVQISSVLNQSQVLDPTAGANDGVGGAVITVDPQSLETGKAYSMGSGNKAGGYFKEHGIIMGIMSVLPRTAYGGAQIEKYWRKTDRTEFFIPQLQHIGDQEIQQSEIGYDATGTDKDNVFGYAPRWAEYKFKNSTVHGDFLDEFDYWHMAQIGDTSGAGPDLNMAFIEARQNNDEYLRPFANQTETDDRLYCQIYNDVQAIRPMVVHDIPGNTQH